MVMIELISDTDLLWIESAVDIVCRNVGRPWRVALEQLMDLQRAEPTSQRRFTAVVGAIQRILGGRERNTKIAQRTRSLVLGHPALTSDERQARIDHAALVLGMSARQIETLLWVDLPRERPVELPAGRPEELEVAAFANVALIQRALRRAQSVSLAIDGDPGPIVRAASLRGLIVSPHANGDGCVLDIVGPLALCHKTSVYGRALGELVPYLADLRSWSLEIRVELPLARYSLHASSPVLLPAPSARMMATPAPVMRLVRGVRRLEPTLNVEAAPLVVRRGAIMVWPDLVIDTGWRRTYVELVGFWTRDYLERKLAAYRALDLDVVLCVDNARAGTGEAPPPDVLSFTKVAKADVLLAWIRARKHDGFLRGNVPETLRPLLPKIDVKL
jgi:uncharacterized protein